MSDAGLTAIYLDHPYRYRALKMLQDTSKREREAGEMSVKREIAVTQSDAASLMSATMPKKACVGRVGGAGSTDGAASSEKSLGFEAVRRKHQRVVPQQQDISAAIMRPLTDGDLRAANHIALTTAIADFSMRTTLVTTLLNLTADCMCWSVPEPFGRPTSGLIARILAEIS